MCKYCELKRAKCSDDLSEDTFGVAYLANYNNNICLAVVDEVEEFEHQTIYIELNFCPMCGRDLKGE